MITQTQVTNAISNMVKRAKKARDVATDDAAMLAEMQKAEVLRMVEELFHQARY